MLCPGELGRGGVSGKEHWRKGLISVPWCGGSRSAWNVPDLDVSKGGKNCTILELEKGPEEITEGPATCSNLEQVSWVIFQLGFEYLQHL